MLCCCVAEISIRSGFEKVVLLAGMCMFCVRATAGLERLTFNFVSFFHPIAFLVPFTSVSRSLHHEHRQ